VSDRFFIIFQHTLMIDCTRWSPAPRPCRAASRLLELDPSISLEYRMSISHRRSKATWKSRPSLQTFSRSSTLMPDPVQTVYDSCSNADAEPDPKIEKSLSLSSADIAAYEITRPVATLLSVIPLPLRHNSYTDQLHCVTVLCRSTPRQCGYNIVNSLLPPLYLPKHQ
jgi:hypothetical protein